MRGLLEKDIRILSKRAGFLALLIVIAIITSYSSDPVFGTGYLPIVGALFTLTTISYDEYNNGLPFIMTFPIRPKDYAIEKYILGVIVGVIFGIIGLAISAGVGLLKNDMDIVNFSASAAFMFPVFALMISILIPVEIKFGAEKGRIVMIAIGAVAALIGVAFSKLNIVSIDSDALLSLSSQEMGWAAAACFMAGSLVVLIVSALISIAIMNKKEY